MELRELESKRVRLTDTDQNVLVGKVTDYIYPEDNEPDEVESIILRAEETEQLVEFYATDIKSIEII